MGVSNGGVRKFIFRIVKLFVSILFVRSGRRGRKFKSCHLDHISFKPHFYAVCLFITGAFSAVPLSSVCLLSAGFSSGLRCPSAPLRERASSPLREFSFRVPLLFLAFFDFGYKNTALVER